MTRIAPEHATKPRQPKEKGKKKKKLKRQGAKMNLFASKKVHPKDVIVGHNGTKMQSILKQSRLKEQVASKFQESGERYRHIMNKIQSKLGKTPVTRQSKRRTSWSARSADQD